MLLLKSDCLVDVCKIPNGSWTRLLIAVQKLGGKMSMFEKRLTAINDYATGHSGMQRRLLTLLIAMLGRNQVKWVCEELGIEPKRNG